MLDEFEIGYSLLSSTRLVGYLPFHITESASQTSVNHRKRGINYCSANKHCFSEHVKAESFQRNERFILLLRCLVSLRLQLVSEATYWLASVRNQQFW